MTCKHEMSAVVTSDEEQLCPLASLSISARDKVCAPVKEQKPALGHTSM